MALRYQGVAWVIWCLLGLCLHYGVVVPGGCLEDAGVPGGCFDDMVFAGVVLEMRCCGTRGLLG
jgi:hypothetical protein